MDCKILKKTLLISILAISLFYTGEVRADQKCNTTYTSTPEVIGTVCKITIDKIKQNANFYEFYLDGNVALCLNAGKAMSNSKNEENRYVLESTSQITNPWIQKAYTYAVTDSSNIAKRIVAQTIVWYITQFGEDVEKKQLTNAVCSAITSAQRGDCKKNINLNCEAAVNYVEAIEETIPIYSWERVTKDGQYQRLVSQLSGKFVKGYIKKVTGHAYGGNQNLNVGLSLEEIPTITPGEIVPDTTCESECNIKTEVNEASCGTSSFASSSSAGRIYQVSTGSTCKYGIDKENAITYDGENIKKASDVVKDKYQIHCFSELNQEYPGNVATPVAVGRYLVWPNNNINPEVVKKGLKAYPLRLRYSKVCKMDVDSDTLKKDYKTVKDELDAAVSSAKSGNQEGVSSKNGEEGVKRFQNSSEKLDKKSCVSLKTDADTAGKNYQNCVTAGSSACEKKYGTSQDCSYKTGKEYTDCEANNKTLSSCKDGYKDSSGTCNNNDHGNLWDKWNNYMQQQAACDKVSEKYYPVLSQLTKWKEIINTSNTFPGISVRDFNADITVQYTLHPQNSEYNEKFPLQKIKTDSSTTSVDNPNTKTDLKLDPFEDTTAKFNTDVDDNSKEISNKKATIYHTVWYDLNEATGKKDKLPSVNFSSVRKTSIKSINNDNISDSDQNHITTIGFVNLPIPFNAKEGTENLILTVNSLSGTGIDPEIKNAVVNKEYTCTYNITSNPPPPCVCPENTAKAGTNLLDYIKNNNMTCSDAQSKYCGTGDDDDDDDDDDDYECPEGTPNAGYSLNGCIGSGGTYASCKDQLCGEDLKCPESSNATDAMSLQFRDCVSVKINQGKDLNSAKEACNVYCNSKGKKIIYRTISLSNPFPSYDSDETVTQNNLSVGMFNDTIKGRYPGMNWNSTITVKNKILNNRGVDGDKVYTEKKPLYTFKLDAKTIQAIRKYNKKHKYSDFRLNCKMGNAAACVSETFVHDTTYGLKDGTCNKDLNKKTFYTCDD